MTKLHTSLFILLISLFSFSQDTINTATENAFKSLLNLAKGEYESRFELYETDNIWTFIKLDTRNGRMWQVQFDIEGDNRFTSILSLSPRVDKEMEADNRFKLYPTQNNWNFILLDKFNGRLWQVQWSIDSEKRLIIPIKAN
jgi:hypothetical protein